jgi:hypothetical protein
VKWVDVMEAVLAHLTADAGLTAALAGGAIRRHGTFIEPAVPSLAWITYGNVLDENTEVVPTQWDIFAQEIDQAIAIERRLRALLHRDTPQVIGGIPMWTQFVDARDHADPEPGRIHRSLDFRFEPAREDR